MRPGRRAQLGIIGEPGLGDGPEASGAMTMEVSK